MAERILEKTKQIFNEDLEKAYVHSNPRPNSERPTGETIKPPTENSSKPGSSKKVAKK